MFSARPRTSGHPAGLGLALFTAEELGGKSPCPGFTAVNLQSPAPGVSFSAALKSCVDSNTSLPSRTQLLKTQAGWSGWLFFEFHLTSVFPALKWAS